MARADYNAREIPPHKIWSIVDEDRGRMSVTNDIENVVGEICTRQNIEAKDYKWIYRDSEGSWNGWDPVKEDFISLGADDEREATKRILNHHYYNQITQGKRVRLEDEWEAFQKHVRRFDDEVPEKRYGILNPSADPPFSEIDMLYAPDPMTLHNLHYDNWPSIVLREHLDNIEIMEDKKPKGYTSLIHKQKP